jgi:MFS transporter, DHA1 family, multidrug resistance protein
MMLVTHAIFAACVLGLVVFYKVTPEDKSTGPVFNSWLRRGVVAMNPGFTYLLLIFAAAPMCLLSFLGIAACAAFGPALCLK